MSHSYFIAYNFNDGDAIGIGNHFLILDQPIRSIEDIRMVEAEIANYTDKDVIVITNFKELPG